MGEASPARSVLTTRILEALQESGRSPDSISYKDLIPVSELHNRGKQATIDLARMADITPYDHVLDVGCGIGGPARTLVSEFECRVTGVEISKEYCSTAQSLNELVGLSERISIRHGDARSLPFEDEQFDVVWTQHTSMNLADKAAMFGEMCRVLRLGGKLALHDVLAGTLQPIHFPVPWAFDESSSYLVLPQRARELLQGAGFEELSWEDQTQITEEWWRNVFERSSSKVPSLLNPGLVMGSHFPLMAHNMYRNIRERRVVVVQAAYRKVLA